MPYLFNRSARLAPGNLLDSMAWAVKMTEKVNAVADVDFRLWTRVLGSKVGTLSWSAVVGDVAELTTTEEKLLADGGYTDLAEDGVRFGDGNGFDDALVRLVHADPDGFASAQYASITTGVLAPGMTADGIALGVEMAHRIKAVTGRPTSFVASVTGPFGEVGFIVLSDTIEEVQGASEALTADADWIALIDERASKAFVSGASERMITRRLV